MNLIALNRQLIFKKKKKKTHIGNLFLSWTHLCSVEIGTEHTLTLLKARRISKENALLLKFQKQTITAALNRVNALMFLLMAPRKLWIYQVLPFIVSLRNFTNQNKISSQEFCRITSCKFIQNGNLKLKIGLLCRQIC